MRKNQKENMLVGTDRGNFKWCPVADCDTIVTKPKCCCAKNAVCPTCSTVMCFKCGTVHKGKCMNYKTWAKGQQGRYKSCPKCDSPVEKSMGCNHMSCAVCKLHFCWLCLKDITKE